MNISKDELITVLSQFNPWWRGEPASDLPAWRRAAFGELFRWVYAPPLPRAVLLSGARQVGKTTLLFQIINELLKQGTPAANIFYTTFDHPIIKLAGINAILEAWRIREPKAHGPEYLFLDEAQFMLGSGTWVKHQVDFSKERRIVFTGSAMPLLHKEQESGVGRWHTIWLSTLSFYEYLKLKESSSHEVQWDNFYKNMKLSHKSYDLHNLKLENEFSMDGINQNDEAENYKLFKKFLKSTPEKLLIGHNLPKISSLRDLFEWPSREFVKISEKALSYVGHFHGYLLRGGFPQTVQLENINQVQRILREDIIDKVLKRDMTALFGVRRVLDLEQTFLYLCMHDSGLLDIQNLCSNLEVKRPTAQHFIELLEASHLIYRLQPFGYGKEVLRAKYKVYLADAAIAPAVLLKGKNILDDPKALGVATETAVFKHLFARYYTQNVRFTYWRDDKKQEVDLVAEINGKITPFEVKYRSNHASANELKGLVKLCQTRSVEYGYLITKSLDDFGPIEMPNSKTKIMRIPAPLLCYWMGEAELLVQNDNFQEKNA